MTLTQQIRELALELLDINPSGLKYSELQKLILEKKPSFKTNTVNGAMWDLELSYPSLVYKPDRGLFRLL